MQHSEVGLVNHFHVCTHKLTEPLLKCYNHIHEVLGASCGAGTQSKPSLVGLENSIFDVDQIRSDIFLCYNTLNSFVG